MLLNPNEIDTWLHCSIQDVIRFQYREPFAADRMVGIRTDDPWRNGEPPPPFAQLPLIYGRHPEVTEDKRMAALNINEADRDDIDAVDGLRGHGFEIVRYREERGRFGSLRQLDEVPGLTGKLDDETRSRLTI